MAPWQTLPMRERELDLSRIWTEEEYLALGETDIRYELIGWKLQVSPPPSRPHQGISRYLANFLEPAARSAGFRVFEAIGIRLSPGDIVSPDVAVGKLGWEGGAAAASDVVLMVEVTSPSNARSDRVTKKELYAASGIPWYLLVEPGKPDLLSVALHLYRLEHGRYVQHAVARHGQILRSDDPFPISVDTTRLIMP